MEREYTKNIRKDTTPCKYISSSRWQDWRKILKNETIFGYAWGNMKVKELEKEIRGQITVLDKKELEKVLKFINQILNDPTI